mgnify:FL=1
MSDRFSTGLATHFKFIGRAQPSSSAQATGKYNRIKTIDGSSGIDFFATASERGAAAFTIEDAGSLFITAAKGGSVAASTLTGSLDTVFEIGVQRVSGSGSVNLLFP